MMFLGRYCEELSILFMRFLTSNFRNIVVSIALSILFMRFPVSAVPWQGLACISLSILFMRFILARLRVSMILSVRVWLSILFMRFLHKAWKCPACSADSFNSLYEIPDMKAEFIRLLRESLSILFMRFCLISSWDSARL